MHTSLRVRWAAIGAAVSVSLGAGGLGWLTAHATAPSGATAFVPIAPCRLFDTRPEFAVGPRTAALGPGETWDVQALGAQGGCQLPLEARGVTLNVTAADPTQATFLTLFPAGVERPNASHLNPEPDDGPAPNAVTTELSPAGAFSVFNRFGNVHVLADVVGYYTDHHHDDRYPTRAEHSAALTAARRQTVVIPGSAAHALAGTTAHDSDGWAWLTSGVAMTFPIVIPAGSTIRTITYTYRDEHTQDLLFSFDELPLTDVEAGSLVSLGFESEGDASGIGAETIDELAFVVKPGHAYNISVWATGGHAWPSQDLAVRAITVTYDLP